MRPATIALVALAGGVFGCVQGASHELDSMWRESSYPELRHSFWRALSVGFWAAERKGSSTPGAFVHVKGLVVIKKPVSVTDAELAVLKVLWARGPLTAKAITEAVYPDGAESEFAAVHSFLQRLERKGLVARDRSSFVHVFSPTASQADVLGQELKTLAERLGGDSIAPLIMQLIDQKRLSKKEAAEIRKLLDKYSK